MRLAIIHENWGAGAARCAHDLRRELGHRHQIYFFPRAGEIGSTDDLLKELLLFDPDVVNCHSFYGNLPYDFLATVSKRYPTCFTVHDPSPIGTMESECWECK